MPRLLAWCCGVVRCLELGPSCTAGAGAVLREASLRQLQMLQRGLVFVEKTGFPADRLLADPTNATYDALGFKKGVLATFFSPQVGVNM